MWKFDFGPGEPADGYTGVPPDCSYTAEQGYGFEDVDHVYGRERRLSGVTAPKDTLARLRSRFCIPLGTAFVADVPEDGMYLVTVLLGDPLAETLTRLKAGEGKHVLPPLHTLPGQFTEARFTVPVRGGKLRLAVSGTAPRLNALEIAPAPQTLRLFLAGDSTVTDQDASGYPYTGWGQALPALFKHDVCVDNHAVSGRSSKSFVDEGRMDVILTEMKAGDFLFIQFGTIMIRSRTRNGLLILLRPTRSTCASISTEPEAVGLLQCWLRLCIVAILTGMVRYPTRMETM